MASSGRRPSGQQLLTITASRDGRHQSVHPMSIIGTEGSLSDDSNKGWRPTAFFRSEASQDGSAGDEGSLAYNPQLELQVASSTLTRAVRRGSRSQCLPWALQVTETGWRDQFAAPSTPDFLARSLAPERRSSTQSEHEFKKKRKKKKTIVMAPSNQKPPPAGVTRQTVAFQNQMAAGLERYQRAVKARDAPRRGFQAPDVDGGDDDELRTDSGGEEEESVWGSSGPRSARSMSSSSRSKR